MIIVMRGILLSLAGIIPLSVMANDGQLSLHYNRPAFFFEESLPIGNGTIGAVVYGGMDEERLSLNDITLWTGHYARCSHFHTADTRSSR